MSGPATTLVVYDREPYTIIVDASGRFTVAKSGLAAGRHDTKKQALEWIDRQERAATTAAKLKPKVPVLCVLSAQWPTYRTSHGDPEVGPCVIEATWTGINRKTGDVTFGPVEDPNARRDWAKAIHWVLPHNEVNVVLAGKLQRVLEEQLTLQTRLTQLLGSGSTARARNNFAARTSTGPVFDFSDLKCHTYHSNVALEKANAHIRKVAEWLGSPMPDEEGA